MSLQGCFKIQAAKKNIKRTQGSYREPRYWKADWLRPGLSATVTCSGSTVRIDWKATEEKQPQRAAAAGPGHKAARFPAAEMTGPSPPCRPRGRGPREGTPRPPGRPQPTPLFRHSGEERGAAPRPLPLRAGGSSFGPGGPEEDKAPHARPHRQVSAPGAWLPLAPNPTAPGPPKRPQRAPPAPPGKMAPAEQLRHQPWRPARPRAILAPSNRRRRPPQDPAFGATRGARTASGPRTLGHNSAARAPLLFGPPRGPRSSARRRGSSGRAAGPRRVRGRAAGRDGPAGGRAGARRGAGRAGGPALSPPRRPAPRRGRPRERRGGSRGGK